VTVAARRQCVRLLLAEQRISIRHCELLTQYTICCLPSIQLARSSKTKTNYIMRTDRDGAFLVGDASIHKTQSSFSKRYHRGRMALNSTAIQSSGVAYLSMYEIDLCGIIIIFLPSTISNYPTERPCRCIQYSSCGLFMTCDLKYRDEEVQLEYRGGASNDRPQFSCMLPLW